MSVVKSNYYFRSLQGLAWSGSHASRCCTLETTSFDAWGVKGVVFTESTSLRTLGAMGVPALRVNYTSATCGRFFLVGCHVE